MRQRAWSVIQQLFLQFWQRKEIPKQIRSNALSEFSLLTVVTKNSRQCLFLVNGSCRALKLRYTGYYLKFVHAKLLKCSRFCHQKPVPSLFYPITLKALHCLPREIVITNSLLFSQKYRKKRENQSYNKSLNR